MKLWSLILVIIVFLTPYTRADEMVRVQTISKDRLTFVVGLGKGDGIMAGQQSLFSTRKISLSARAVEVSRYFSLWELSEKDSVVPFKKGQTISYSKKVNSIFLEIPRLYKVQDDSFHKEKNYWVGKWYYSLSLSESVSGASSSDQLLRTGTHFEINYLKDWTTKLDWSFGVRYDREVSKRQNPGIEVPNTKFFAIGDIYYHFSRFGESKVNPYLSLGIGIGYSITSISSSISKGYAIILPSIKGGFQTEFSENKFLLAEATIESVSSTETFSSGIEQKTSTLNAKASIGYKF